MKSIRIAITCLLMALSLFAGSTTIEQILAVTPTPSFKPGHKLLPLSYCLSSGLKGNIYQGLAKWGYGVDISFEPTHYDKAATGLFKIDEIGQPSSNFAPGSIARNRAEWAKANGIPVVAWLYRFDTNTDYRTNTMPEEAFAHYTTGARMTASPLGPDSEYANQAALTKSYVDQINAVYPPALWLHQGESGVHPAGSVKQYFPLHGYENDPLIAQAISGMTALQKFEWYSAQKRRTSMPILATVGNAPIITYKLSGDPWAGIHPNGSSYYWKYVPEGMGSLPSFQFYYYGDGKFVSQPGVYDGLTTIIGGMSQGIKAGKPLGYHFLSGGWQKDALKDAPDDLLEGFYRCVYTVGAYGTVAGYFSGTGLPGAKGEDVGTLAPDWLRQLMILGRVHAQFTWLDDYLLTSKLMPGNGVSVVNPPEPNYEYTSALDPTARVIARKLDNRYLVCVWAADGVERTVTITIPGLGTRKYRATAKATLYDITTERVKIIP